MKLNIRQRVFRLVLSSSVITFLVLVVVLIFGMLSIRYNLNEKSTSLSEYSTSYVQDVMKERSKNTLQRLVTSKAQYIDRELMEQSYDVRYLADGMNILLTAPSSDISRRTLPDIADQAIHSGEAYIFYTPALLERGINDAIAEEINRTCNISDLLVPYGNRYRGYISSFMIASESGYFVCVETTNDGSNVVYPDEFLNTYDFHHRPWYEVGKNTTKPVFTDVYIDTDGLASLACVMSYYDGNGNFAGVVSIGYGVQDIYEIVLDTTFGSDGFSFILNPSGNVIISGKEEGIFSAKEINVDLRETSNSDLAETARRMTVGETGVASIIIDDEEYYLAYAPMPASGWSFGTLMSRTTVLAPILAARDEIRSQMEDFRSSISRFLLNLLIGSMIMLTFLLAWIFMSSSRLAKRFVEPIKKLSEGVREISGGNLDKKLEIHTGDELEHLATSFNKMTDELKLYMANLAKETAENERISTELHVATDIQLSMLPHDFDFGRNDFEIYATMHAAKEVGGDFYDFYLLDKNHLVITIADVSGKGVPAALFMAISKTILQNFALSMKTPDDFSAVMTLGNQQLCQNNDEMLFVTVFMGMLDLKTGEFVYVNGGHNAPLVCRDNNFEYLDVGKSCMLGIDEDVPFAQKKITLAAGDMIFLYTDGVTEAMNESRKLFGEDHLQQVLNREDKSESLEVLLENLRKAIKIHAGNAEQSDDITMLALKWNGDDKN